MAGTARLLMYAHSFERTYEDDDWSRIEPFFTDDIVYRDAAGSASGKGSVLAYLKNSVNTIDRSFDERILETMGELRCGEDWVEFDWRATYRKEGRRDLVVRGVHRAEFEGDRIRLLDVVVE